MAGNQHLGAAKAAKNDEFYTQWRDIENEMLAYLDYNPNVFRDKVVLLPCDDPAASNFTKYFALNFDSLGLKKLISTSYAPISNPAKSDRYGQLFLFDMAETKDENYNEDKHWNKGRVYVLERGKDLNHDGKIDKDDLQWDYLEGDGDFRSADITKLRDEADIVISNPPFSLFREFVVWLVEGKVSFSVIGNNNAITYKEVFPLIKNNQMWKGATANSTDMVFEVPLDAEVQQKDIEKAAKLGYQTTHEHKYTRLGNSAWFTNMQHGRRHQPMTLMSLEDNKLYGPKQIREEGYPPYDNYEGIEVAITKAIPSDYTGIMGVPITFLDHYNPEQFEILGTSDDTNYPTTKTYGAKKKVVNGVEKKSQTGRLTCVIREESFGKGTYFDVGYPVRGVYKRLFIRHRTPQGEQN